MGSDEPVRREGPTGAKAHLTDLGSTRGQSAFALAVLATTYIAAAVLGYWAGQLRGTDAPIWSASGLAIAVFTLGANPPDGGDA